MLAAVCARLFLKNVHKCANLEEFAVHNWRDVSSWCEWEGILELPRCLIQVIKSSGDSTARVDTHACCNWSGCESENTDRSGGEAERRRHENQRSVPRESA